MISLHARFLRIAQVGVLFAGEDHLPRLYNLIVREALALTHAETGALYIREGEKVQWASKGTTPSPEGQDSEAHWTDSVPLDRGSLCGQAILEDRILNIPDIRVFPEEHPARLCPEFAGLNNDRPRSALALPLKTPQSGLMGVLLLLNARSSDGTPHSFDSQLEDLMAAVTAQAALAIQNIRWSLQLHDAYQETLYRLSLAAEYREDPSGSHVRRVGQYSALIAAAYGLPSEQVEKIRVASAMHDIGKISIPETILLKPGKLTPEEFDCMKKHATLGALILGGSKTEILQIAERIALTHHEKFDGSGYPYGQEGKEIPLEGRIVGLIDVFDALTTPRPYKTPLPFAQAVEIIRQGSGTHFDPDCVQAFHKIEKEIQPIVALANQPATPQSKTAGKEQIKQKEAA